MVKVSLEVRGVGGAFGVLVRAGSIKRAEELATARFPGSAVSVIFPIDGEGFFADGAESLEVALPEAATG